MPRWPYRMRLSRGRDGVLRSHGGVLERLMHVRGRPVRTRSWQTRAGYVHVRAESVEPAEVEHQVVVEEQGEATPAGEEELGIAVERTRFSLAVLEEMGEFYDAFKRDPLLGPGDPSQALGAPAPPALAVGGALLGDHRAADRGFARRRDPAADRPPLGALHLPPMPSAEARLRRRGPCATFPPPR